MLPPDYLWNCADDILELYTALDERIVRDIARRLAKAGRVTDTAAWQAIRAQESGLLYQELIQEIARVSNASEQQVKDLFQDAGMEAVRYDSMIYEAAGLSPPPLALSPSAMQVLTAGLQKTNGYLRNLTLTTAVQSQQAYIRAAALAEMQVESGAFDSVSAIRNAVREASREGAWVQYPTGHRDRIDVAVRRAVLTGVNQTAAQISLGYAGDMGCDLVETTAHAGARPSHAVWQGQVFSRSGRKGYPDFESSTGYGTGEGLCGWNCRHSFFPYFEGLSSSAYPRERLREYEEKTVPYNGGNIPYYEATQKQRAMERSIRESKRELAGLDEAIQSADGDPLKAGLQANFNAASAKLKQREAALKDFLSQTGLVRDGAREQVQGFGRSQSQKSVWVNKKVKAFAALTGLKTPEGITVSAVSDHFGLRSIERGVSQQNIRAALTGPLKVGKIRADKSAQYIGEHATVVINSETGKLITAWPTGQKTAGKLKGKTET